LNGIRSAQGRPKENERRGETEGARDADRYASAEFHFIGVDELTQFDEKQLCLPKTW
jgi:hypothetical protein